MEIYADRLSITSYGGLVPGLSKEEFFAGRSMIRNRELMRVYRDLYLVEQLGSGMNRILRVYPKDIFHFSENFMEVCFTFDDDYMPTGQATGHDKDPENTGEFRKEFGSNVARAFEIICEFCRIM